MPNKHNEIEKDWFSMATVERQLKTLVKEDYLNNYERCKTKFTTVLDLAKMDLRYIIQNLENAEKKRFPRKILFLYQQKSFLEKLIAELDCDNPKKENLDIIENLDNKVQLPENLKELLSIWHDKNDTVNLLKIYNEHISIFTKSTKKLMSCFAYELYEKKWLTEFEQETFNATDIAKIFLGLANLKFNPNYNSDFNFLVQKPKFNIKYSKRIKIDMK